MANKLNKFVARGRFLLPLLAALSASTWAETVTVNVTGRVVASPCVVDVNDKEQTVSFGKMTAASLSSAGAVGNERSFSIRLTDCPETTTMVMAKFTGTPDPNDPNLFRTDVEGGGTYSGVGIKVKLAGQGWNDNSIRPSESSMLGHVVSQDTHSVTFQFDSRVQSTTGSVVSGNFLGAMMVTFTYL